MNEFFANLYELMIYVDPFSEDMLNESLCIPIGLCMLLIPMAVLAFYYYVVNSTRLNRWWHWLILVLIICLINFGISYGISFNGIKNITYDGESPNGLNTYCFSLSLANFIWCFLVSFVWSLMIKWGSTSCRKTPF